MADRYTNDPTRNAAARTTHDPTSAQGGGGGGESHSGTWVATGGGTSPLAGSKQGLAAQVLTGAGTVTPVGQKGGLRAGVLTGGGTVVTASTTARQSAAVGALTGGGVVTPAGQKGGMTAYALGGGGIVVIDQTTGRAALLTLTGGGEVIFNGEAGEGQPESPWVATGGGSVVIAGRKGGLTAYALAGAGTVDLETMSGRQSARVLTGGGTVNLIGQKGALAAAVLSGGGTVVVDQTTARAALLALTGGGTVVFVTESEGGESASAEGTWVATGGGGVVLSGRKGGQVLSVITGGGRFAPVDLLAPAGYDPSFETGLANWYNAGSGATLTRDAAFSYDGLWSVRVERGGGTGTGVIRLLTTPAINVIPGMSYSANAYRRSTVGRALRMLIAWYNGAGANVGEALGAENIDGSGSWSVIPTVSGIVPANAVSMRVGVYNITGAVPEGEQHWIDRVRFARTNLPYLPGHTVTALITGGGQVQPGGYESGHTGAFAVTGGGRVLHAREGAHVGTLILTGGGTVDFLLKQLSPRAAEVLNRYDGDIVEAIRYLNTNRANLLNNETVPIRLYTTPLERRQRARIDAKAIADLSE